MRRGKGREEGTKVGKRCGWNTLGVSIAQMQDHKSFRQESGGQFHGVTSPGGTAPLIRPVPARVLNVICWNVELVQVC